MATPTWSVFMLTRGTIPSREEGGGVSAKHPPPCPRSAAYTRITANTPVVGNKREPRRKNLTNPGESLSTGAALPESIIPKGYFLVLVPSVPAYLSTPTRPALFAPLLPPTKKERRKKGGGISFSPTFGRTLFFSAARGENYGRVGWKKRDTRVLDSPRWVRGSFC